MIVDIEFAAEGLIEASRNLDPNFNEYSKYKPHFSERASDGQLTNRLSFLRDPEDEQAGCRVFESRINPDGVSAWVEGRSFIPG